MHKLKKFIFTLRKYLVLIFTLSFYMLSVYYFFVNVNLLVALMFSIFLFIMFHYFIIEIKKTNISFYILLFTFFALGLLFYIGFDNFFYVIAIIVFHLALVFLLFDIYEEVYNRIVINSWKVFTMGAKMYSLLLSLVFALSFLGTYKTFNITCQDINHFVQKASAVALHKFGIQLPKLQDTKVKDVVAKIASGNNQILTGNDYSKLTLANLVKPEFWKNAIVNQIMENKKILDKNICQIIIDKIKQEYTNPGFKFGVMFLIFFLFYPFIRLVIFLLAFVNFIMFHLARLAGIYKYTKVVEEVEMIE